MNKPLPRTYWRHVDIPEDPNACWLWTGQRSNGYGRWTGWGNKATPKMAHILSYQAHVGPIPDSLVLDHTCHNDDPGCSGGPDCRHRRCVNPAHLEPITRGENVLRSPHTRASKNKAKTHCKAGHEFTPENTYRYPSGRRRCITCRDQWNVDAEVNASNRARYASDPEYANTVRARNRARYRANASQINAANRERYASDPEYAQHVRDRNNARRKASDDKPVDGATGH
jgi:hypothetical protein